MLEKLTRKQIELQSKIRDEWINIALHQQNFDKEELEAGVKWLYYSSNLEEPKVIFVDSPKDFSKKITASVGASVGDSVWDSVGASVRDSVGDSVWDSVRASVWDSVGASVGDSVWDSVGDSVRASVRTSVGASVWDSVWTSVGASVRDSVVWTSLCGDAEFGAWYEYWKKIGIVKNKKADKYIGFLKSGAFFCMFFGKVAFVMRRPIKVNQNERKQLHSISEPALEWIDGTKIYKLNGITFEESLWKKISDGSITPQEVFKIGNMEQRRVAYEFMDKTKMKELPNFRVLDEGVDSYKNPHKVIEFTIEGFSEPFRYYNCICPSSGREYFVETKQTTCKTAKMASFGLSNDVVFNEEF